jgi:alpha-D-xyloside xylohydrolase
VIFPGANGTSALYEDDGISFDHRRGESMRLALQWRDDSGRLTLQLAPNSRMLPPAERRIVVRVAGSTRESAVVFTGRPIQIPL